MGRASEITTFSGSAASIRDTRVDPQRDMWKMKPVGGIPGLAACQAMSSSIDVRWVNRLLKGSRCACSMVWSKNGWRKRSLPSQHHSTSTGRASRIGTQPWRVRSIIERASVRARSGGWRGRSLRVRGWLCGVRVARPREMTCAKRSAWSGADVNCPHERRVFHDDLAELVEGGKARHSTG